MTLLRLPYVFALALGFPLAGCDSDTEEVTATASESGESSGSDTGDQATSSGGSSGVSTTVTGTSGDSATTAGTTGTEGETTAAETGVEGESSGTGGLEACSDATSASNCQSTASETCAWFPTSHAALDAGLACGDLEIDEGYCLAVGPVDRTCTDGFLPTCPDGTPVLYREAGLEVGAIELLVVDGETPCEVPDEFQPCQVNADPKPGSKLSYFPAECACACE